MIKLRFKNFRKSDFVANLALEKLEVLIERFPDLQKCRTELSLSMENSPTQAGPDQFSVQLICSNGRYRGLQIKKSAPSIYLALAELFDQLHESLNRFGDRERMRRLRGERRFKFRQRIPQERTG